MVTREAVAAWVGAYRRAWESSSRSDIAAAFAEDAVYYPSPAAPAWVGLDAIVDGWLEHRDDTGSTRFTWSVVAVEADTAVIRGVSTYPSTVYDNLWLVRLGPDGRAVEFTEFWVDRSAPVWD